MRRGARRKHSKVEAHTTTAPALPPLDEATFQQLLEAAYVLQERKEARPEAVPAPRRVSTAGEVLALIAETQEQLRVKVHDLATAANLIAERLEQVTNAAGVAVAVIHGEHLEFCTATGVLASLAGSSAPVGSNLPEMLRAHSWSSVERAIHYDAKCPVVFPIFHEGRTIGLLHLSFPEAEKLEEHQIRTCQVMAGMMGEAITRVYQQEWKQSLTAERNSMIELLEQLRPQLERLAGQAGNQANGISDAVSENDLAALLRNRNLELAAENLTQPDSSSAPEIGRRYSCPQCGTATSETDVFCEKCGAPQLNDLASLTSPLPETNSSQPAPKIAGKADKSLPASAPEKGVSLPPSLEQALAHLPSRGVIDRFRPRPHSIRPETTQPKVEPIPGDIPKDAALRDGSFHFEISGEHTQPAGWQETAQPPLPPAEEVPEPPSQAVLPLAGDVTEEKPDSAMVVPAPQKASPWGSAGQARQWLESLQQADSPGRIWLNKHRADLWVVVAVLLLLLALSGLGSRSAIYGAAHSKVVQPSLTLFERLLVALDLAQPPPVPIYLGNPNVRVWVDLHTALYYCPEADLYGKTAEGKFTTQRDAQLDQFEPAARKYCQ